MNILAVGAHFDDVELACSGTLMKHVDNGDNVTIMVVTDSAYRNADGVLVRSAEVAYEEGKKAAEMIGAEMICLNYKTFEVPFDDYLGREILDHIEKRNIECIYSHWVNDIHRDHQCAGRSAMMAGRHVPRFLMYRSNYYDTEAHFHGNFYSDITPYMDRKVGVIKSHKSELERVKYKWLDFFMNQNSNEGQKIGVKYAECFEVVRYLT
jgi:LmbE family N-acetylglucosaminyl deacetylase